MKQKHFDEFCELLDTVAEQYGKTMTMSLKMLYWQGLHDVDFEAVRESYSAIFAIPTKTVTLCQRYRISEK
ncbi:MAG: hypothetical protein H0X02_04840 [Nitrosomonas sp.]|nr:hypothetical protein [Nitrosomonas sp.]